MGVKIITKVQSLFIKYSKSIARGLYSVIDNYINLSLRKGKIPLIFIEGNYNN